MDYPIDLPFNSKPPTVLHIDLNSCFATVEQQADPRLRGKPIAVAAYKSPGGCILAPSIEAKRFGIKTGMRVKDGRQLCPDLIVMEPDPWKYRNINLALKRLLLNYTDDVFPKSIDEFVLDLADCPAYQKGMLKVGAEIKKRIREEIGEWLTVSIGIAPNRYLAKVASGIKKPDGLDIIDASNYSDVYSRLALEDLCGIKQNNAARLNTHGVFSVEDFFNAPPMVLQNAFHAVTGHYWYLRLRGWEVDDIPLQRRSYSNSVALGEKRATAQELAPVLTKLVEKMSSRMRARGYSARGVHLSLLYKQAKNGSRPYWHKGITAKTPLFSATDVYRVAYKLLSQSPYTGTAHGLPVHIIAVTCFNLVREKYLQLHMLDAVDKKLYLTKAMDAVNQKWGSFVLTPARMLNTHNIVKDRVAFGGIKELEEIILL